MITELEDGTTLTPYIACMIAEGCEDSTVEDQDRVWAYLIGSGAVWSLQGFYGRTAKDLINSGRIDMQGNINRNVET